MQLDSLSCGGSGVYQWEVALSLDHFVRGFMARSTPGDDVTMQVASLIVYMYILMSVRAFSVALFAEFFGGIKVLKTTYLVWLIQKWCI